MQRFLLRLATFLLLSAFNGAFARTEAVTQFKPDLPREQTFLAVVLPPQTEVLRLDLLEPNLAVLVPLLENNTNFAVQYSFLACVIAVKHRARAPPLQ
jgi:hypothetical protein